MKDHPNATLDLSGHSKGGMNAQMVLAYLENYINDRPPMYEMKNTRVYTYNSAPWEWQGEQNHPNIYPRRVRGDPVSMIWGAAHPNLKTITHTHDGKKISIVDAHGSENFYNQDLSKITSLKESTTDAKKLEAIQIRDNLNMVVEDFQKEYDSSKATMSPERQLQFRQAQINLYKSQVQLIKLYDNSPNKQQKIDEYELLIKQIPF